MVCSTALNSRRAVHGRGRQVPLSRTPRMLTTTRRARSCMDQAKLSAPWDDCDAGYQKEELRASKHFDLRDLAMNVKAKVK